MIYFIIGCERGLNDEKIRLKKYSIPSHNSPIIFDIVLAFDILRFGFKFKVLTIFKCIFPL